MIRITIIVVGKIKEKYLTDACNEYMKRLNAFSSPSIIEIPEYRCPDNPSDADIANVIKNEGDRILSAIPSHAAVIPMCIEGKMLSSTQLAEEINSLSVNGFSNICFIIGGSFGLDERVKSQGKIRLSMSPMTFPHMLARVMLLEQIYRSFSILKGTKYHK